MHVFVRIDRLKPSLHHRYDGPFVVVRRFSKDHINEKDETKPVFDILRIRKQNC